MPALQVEMIKAVFEADASQVIGEAAKAGDAMEKMGDRTDASGRKASQGMGLMGAAIATALVGAGKAAIDTALQFESSMTSISALVGATDKEMSAYTETVRRVGVETGVGANQAAEALYFLTSSGMDAAKAQDALEITAKAAATGLGEQADIADVVSSAMNAYAKTGLTAGTATDVMVAAVREGKIEANQFAQTIGKAIPSAAQLGVSFDQISAAVAAMSLTGMDAGEAVTRLDYAMRSMSAPSKRAEKVLAEFGVSGETLRTIIREKGLLAAMTHLREAFKGHEDQLVRGLGSIQAYQGVMALTGENSEQVAQVFADVKNSTGDLDTAFGKVAQGNGFKMKQAMAELQQAGIDVGAQLLPIAATVVGAVGDMAQGFMDLPSGVQVGAVAIAGFVSGIGPALKAIDSLKSAAGGMQAAFAEGAAAGPVGLAVAGLATAAALVYMDMRKNAEEARDRQAALNDALIAAKDPATTMAASYHDLTTNLIAMKKASGEAAEDVEALGGAGFVGDQMSTEMKGMLTDIGVTAEQVWSSIEGGSDAFDRVKQMGGDAFRTLETATQGADGATKDLLTSIYDSVKAGDLNASQALRLVGALDDLSDATDDNREARARAYKADIDSLVFSEAVTQGFVDQAMAASDATDDLGRYEDVMAAIKAANPDAEIKDTAAAADDLSGSASEAAIAADDMNSALSEQEQAAADAAGAMKEYEKGVKDLNKAIDDYLGLNFSIPESVDKIRSSLNGMQEEFGKNNAALNDFSAGSIANRGVLSDYVGEVADLIQNMQKLNQPVADQKQALADFSGELANQMHTAGFTEDAIAEYVAIIENIPTGDVAANVRKGLEDSMTAAINATVKVDEFGTKVYTLPDGREVIITADTMKAIDTVDEFVGYVNRQRPTIVAYMEIQNSASNMVAESDTAAPARQHGGPVTAGRPYIVGELRPEVFVPTVPGRIEASVNGWGEGTGGSGPTTFNFMASADTRAVAEAKRIYDALLREQRRRGGRLTDLKVG